MRHITRLLFLLSLLCQNLFADTPDAPNAAPHGEPPPDRFFSELVNMAVTLTFVIVILLIISWFVRKMLSNRVQQLNTRNGIKILEQRALSQKSSIYILEIYGKGIAVAESSNGIVHLGEFSSPSAEGINRSTYEPTTSR